MQKTTVVIPNLNGMKYLDACLKSIFEGSLVPPVILVDNGSVDDSCKFVEKKYPQVQIMKMKYNTGFCHAVNSGIKEAKTEYVILLNNDTIVDRCFAEELQKELEVCKLNFSVAARMINMKEMDKIDDAGDFYCALGWSFARGRDQSVSRFLKPGRIFSACAGAAIYRKSMLGEIGYFDENHFAYLEDIDIGYRANIFGYRNMYAPKAVVYHAGSGSSGSRHNEFKVDLSSRNSIYLIYKNMPLIQILINLPFLMIGFLVKILFFCRKRLGIVYVKGLSKGIRLSFSKKGRRQKVKFTFRHLKGYLFVQWELWVGILRRFFS